MRALTISDNTLSGINSPFSTRQCSVFDTNARRLWGMANETKIKEDTVTVPVAQSDLDAVSNAEFYNPTEFLAGISALASMPIPPQSVCCVRLPNP